MNSKDFLMRYKQINQKITCEKEQLKFLDNLKTNIEKDLNSLGLSEKTGKNYFAQCEKVINHLKNDIAKETKRSVKIMEDIYGIINSVENADYKSLLTYKYINMYTYEEIEELMHVSRSNLFRFHNKALEEIQPLIKS